MVVAQIRSDGVFCDGHTASAHDRATTWAFLLALARSLRLRPPDRHDSLPLRVAFPATQPPFPERAEAANRCLSPPSGLSKVTSFSVRPDRARLANSPALGAFEFVDGMNPLGLEIPGGVVALVDTLVQPFNCDMDGADTVLLDQFTR